MLAAIATVHEYSHDQFIFTTEGISPEQLKGFFDGWPNPPSPETHLRLLKNSDEIDRCSQMIRRDMVKNTIEGRKQVIEEIKAKIGKQK